MSESEGAKGIDLGWNDPPMFSYDSRQVYNNVKKPSLTKRVGLSWDSSSPPPTIARTDEPILPASAPPRGSMPGPPPPSFTSTLPPSPSLNAQQPLQTAGLPPLPSAPPMEPEPAPKSPSSGTSECLGEPTSTSGEINLDLVSKALNELADELFGDKEREKAEINKRLSIVESLWSDDKFPADLKEKLYGISEALKLGNVDEADKLQRGLMIDHSTLCSTWMAAVRKLIAAKRSVVDS